MNLTQKPELLILSALPGAGKTTYAHEWLAESPDTRRRMNWDELRIELYGPNWKFNRAEEAEMKLESVDRVSKWLDSGLSVVIDNTNLTEKARKLWTGIGALRPCKVAEQEINTPVADCVRRDRRRQGGARVGQAVIDRMALTTGWIDWDDESVYHKSASGKDFVLVDVDGTLADCEHRRHYVRDYKGTHLSTCSVWFTPDEATYLNGKCVSCGEKKFKKDWPAFFRECSKDTPIEPILKLARMLGEHYYLIVVSGRPINPCGKDTEDWLLLHAFDPLHLFMRDSSDSREDSIVKQEILDLLPKERIAYVLDDRDQVVQMWRKNGLTTLQVANGDF